MTKPLLHWAGGKAWAVPLLAPRISLTLDETGGRYIEPFVGGGAMAFAIARPQMRLSDACTNLINFYRVIRDESCKQLRKALNELGSCITKDWYYWIRDEDEPTCPIERAAKFIYLNKTGYNGLHRENKNGKFNVPFGKPYRHDPGLFPSLEHLQEVAAVLQDATLITVDFIAAIRHARPGDLLYIDPPYHGGFVSYVAGGFSDDDQTRLAEELFLAHERDVTIVAHNAKTELIEYLYGEWAQLGPTGEKRAINSDAAGRGDASCVIITATP